MNEKLILAVDLGTSGMKVALITVSGKVLGWEAEPVKLLISPDGGAEQSPDEWWRAFLSAAGRLLKREPAAAKRVGELVSVHVIPRPAADLDLFLPPIPEQS